MKCPNLARFTSIAQSCVLIFALVYAGKAQPLSTMDTVQNLKITEVEDLAVANGQRIKELETSLSDLNASVNRGTGAVIGFGMALTLLQALQMLAAWKKS